MSQKDRINLKDKMDKLCSTPASRVAVNINKYENDHTKKVLKDYGRFVKQFEDFFDLLTRLVYKVNYIKKETWHASKSIQFLIVAYSLETFNSSFDLLLKGHYGDSVILSRSIYESLIRVIYLSCYPDEGYSVFIKKRNGTKEFNLTGFLKEELKLDWEKYYSLMSAITHSKAYQIGLEVKKINDEGQKTPIGLQLKFDKKFLEIGINLLYFLLWTFLKTTLLLFVKAERQQITPEFIKKSQEVEKALEELFTSHPNKTWSNTRDDVNYIFNIIEEAEKGNDWKKLVPQ